jgi:hypothetical protein
VVVKIQMELLFMRKFLWIGTIAAVGLTGQALAQDAISYSYLEADYLSTDFDRDATFGVKVDGDGFGLQGAVAFGPMLHGYVEYTNQDFDFDLSIETVEVGIGGSWSVAENASIFGRAAYASGDVDFFDDDGYALQAGVRALVSPALELEGLIHYRRSDPLHGHRRLRRQHDVSGQRPVLVQSQHRVDRWRRARQRREDLDGGCAIQFCG